MSMAEDIKDEFAKNGYAVIRDFYDDETEVAPIREGVQRIIKLLCGKHGVDAPCKTPQEAMTKGYSALVAKNNACSGEILEAVQHIPEFVALVSARENAEVVETLRDGSAPGLAGGGYGISIDSPSDDRDHTHWRQEFPAQLRSPDGIVFWSPLLAMTPEMGPIEIAPGSQAEGILPVEANAGGVGHTGHTDRLSKYKPVAPTTKPGDLILMDFLTFYRSGINRSDRPCWSMQFRYFNFNNPKGIEIGWSGR